MVYNEGAEVVEADTRLLPGRSTKNIPFAGGPRARFRF